MESGFVEFHKANHKTATTPHFDGTIHFHEYSLGVEMEIIIKTEPDKCSTQDVTNNENSNEEVGISADKNKHNENMELEFAHKTPRPICILKKEADSKRKIEISEQIVLSEKPRRRIRYGKEEYICKICSYTSTVERAHLNHMQEHCLGKLDKVKLSCDICGIDFDTSQDLQYHMDVHKDGLYICCDVCIFRSLQLKKVIQHRRTHTGEKPHLCPHCTYRSSRRDNLRLHVRRMHNVHNLFKNTFIPGD